MFKTQNFALACYLIAAKKLRFNRIEPDHYAASICFDDPESLGPSLEAEFVNGALVPATEYHHQLRTLRKRIDTVQREAAQAARASKSGGRQ
jgi:hypothetical protein